MRVVYKFSKVLNKTNQKPFKNYYIELDNGRLVQIRCSFDKDYALLSAVAVKI